jgi:GNAT superfamily N-acetyltransferase
MTDAIQFRLYDPSDRDGLLALFRSVYGAEADRKTSSWRYLDRPLRRALISVAVVNGRIVGTQPSYEVLVKVSDETVPGAVFLDVMTHPDYRSRGVFKGVVEHLRRECHDRGMKVLLTTPNADAARGFRRLASWRCLGELTPLVRPVTVLGLLRRSRGGTPCPANAGGTDLPDRRVDQAWQQFAGAAPTMLVRNTEYITWRFSNHGPRRYRTFAEEAGTAGPCFAVAGAGALLGRRVVFLTEFLAPAGEVQGTRRLLDAVAQHARASGAGAVVAYHTPGSLAARLLRRAGFWEVIRPLRPRPYMVWMATSLDERRASETLDLDSWHMSMGDSDLA